MIIPIRCFTCNKVIGSLWEPYLNLLEKGNTKEEALNKIGLKRYCCRSRILGNVELCEKIIKYT